jgi:hypothetical protein
LNQSSCWSIAVCHQPGGERQIVLGK